GGVRSAVRQQLGAREIRADATDAPSLGSRAESAGLGPHRRTTGKGGGSWLGRSRHDHRKRGAFVKLPQFWASTRGHSTNKFGGVSFRLQFGLENAGSFAAYSRS